MGSKKGIPKSRLPSGLEGICRLGKAKWLHKNLFSVNIKHYGPYLFKTDDSKIFNPPHIAGEKVIVSFLGSEDKIYFPYRVCNIDNTRILYEKK